MASTVVVATVGLLEVVQAAVIRVALKSAETIRMASWFIGVRNCPSKLLPMDTIGVLTSGGDAPGMNAAIRAVAKVASARNVRVLGIERGYDGLIDGRFRQLTRAVSWGMAPIGALQSEGNKGGTMLGTARSSRFLAPEGRQEASNRLLSLGVRGLVVIGGNGSVAGAHHLAIESPIPIVAIPASIDNDIGCTSDAIGVDTALNTIVEACDRISDTAQSLKRAFVVEVMGRQSGYLAMSAAVASAADAVLIPEHQSTEEEIVDSIAELIHRNLATERAKRLVLIIKAEGVSIPTDRLVSEIEARLLDTNIDVRGAVLGHIVRGGAPSFHDRMLAGRLGLVAVEAIMNGITDHMTAWRTTVSGGRLTSDPMVELFPITDVLNETEALLDGTSEITKRRIRRMEDIQGVLAL